MSWLTYGLVPDFVQLVAQQEYQDLAGRRRYGRLLGSHSLVGLHHAHLLNAGDQNPDRGGVMRPQYELASLPAIHARFHFQLVTLLDLVTVLALKARGSYSSAQI